MRSSAGVAGLLLCALCCALAATHPDVAAAATLHIESRTACLDPNELELRLESLLQGYEGGDRGSVTVLGNRGENNVTVATLRVITITGEIVIERRFDLKPEDCPSSTDLLAMVLDTFLRDFPRERWGEEPASRSPVPLPRRVLVTQDVSEFAGQVFAAVDSRWLPASGDLEVGAALDVGSERHRLTASGAVRVGYPHALGGGRYFETLAMLGVGWRYAAASWIVRAEVRTGGLLVSGVGYSTNHHAWLAWLEGQAVVLWQGRDVLVGPQIGISPLSHRVSIANGEGSSIPRVRVGLVVAMPFWSQKM